MATTFLYRNIAIMNPSAGRRVHYDMYVYTLYYMANVTMNIYLHILIIAIPGRMYSSELYYILRNLYYTLENIA